MKKGMVVFLLVVACLAAYAQNGHTPQGAGNPSHSNQSQDYRQNIEKRSGYDVPNGGPLTQPWVWTLAAAALVLFIGFIYKGKTDRELDA